jgi:hypothetical protein
VLTDNKNAANQIFNLILTEALKEDCEREAALYKDSGSEHVFSEKFEKNIATIEKQLKRKQSATKLKKSAPKLATAAAAIIVCVTLATNPSVSAFFKDIIVRITGGFNQHEFNDDVVITIENFNHELRPAYLPEGYRITFAYYSLISMLVEFNDEDFNAISLQYGLANSIAISVDNEHSEPHSILVNGREAVFYESNTKDRPSYLVWNIGGYGFVLSAQIKLGEFVKIA